MVPRIPEIDFIKVIVQILMTAKIKKWSLYGPKILLNYPKVFLKGSFY